MGTIDIHSVHVGLVNGLFRIPPEARSEVIELVELFGRQETWSDESPELILERLEKAQIKAIQKIKTTAPPDRRENELDHARRVYLAISHIKNEVRVILSKAA